MISRSVDDAVVNCEGMSPEVETSVVMSFSNAEELDMATKEEKEILLECTGAEVLNASDAMMGSDIVWELYSDEEEKMEAISDDGELEIRSNGNAELSGVSSDA